MLWVCGGMLVIAFTLLWFCPEKGPDYRHWRR